MPNCLLSFTDVYLVTLSLDRHTHLFFSLSSVGVMSDNEFIVFQIPFHSKYKMRMSLIRGILVDWNEYNEPTEHVSVIHVDAVDDGIAFRDDDVVYRRGVFTITCVKPTSPALSDGVLKSEISGCARLLNKLFWWEPPKGDAIDSDTVTGTGSKGNVHTMVLDTNNISVRPFTSSSVRHLSVPPVESL